MRDTDIERAIMTAVKHLENHVYDENWKYKKEPNRTSRGKKNTGFDKGKSLDGIDNRTEMVEERTENTKTQQQNPS